MTQHLGLNFVNAGPWPACFRAQVPLLYSNDGRQAAAFCTPGLVTTALGNWILNPGNCAMGHVFRDPLTGAGETRRLFRVTWVRSGFEPSCVWSQNSPSRHRCWFLKSMAQAGRSHTYLCKCCIYLLICPCSFTGQMKTWMDGRMDGWTDRRMDA